MDVAWLILDSLSFEATPFAEGGPNTMPQIRSLSKDHATVYTSAYSPGPTSPSSHGSFFTGELPSKTGMHEATPNYTNNYQTIIEALSETHRSFMISSNPFIFNGLDKSLDEKQDLISNQYMLFDEATDPREVKWGDSESTLEHYLRVIFEGGKPVRSFINGLGGFLYNKVNDSALPEFSKSAGEMYQYASHMNSEIRTFLESSKRESFVIANYMDVHAPLDASEDTIARFSDKSRDELPVGVRGQEVYRRVMSGETGVGEDMFDLYKAAIFDTEKKVASLVRDLINSGTFVIITADHGNWFRRERDLEESRIHIPLIIFSPTENSPRVIDKTVNIRSMPRTTMEAVNSKSGGFNGVDLLSVEEHQLSITEFIHDAKADGSPVTPTGASNARYDFALTKGDARLDHIDGEFIPQRGDEEVISELSKVGEELVQEGLAQSTEAMDISEGTQERLKDLGYMG